MPARNATIEDLKKSYSYYVEYFEEQAKATTVCKGCDERISLYDGHVCRKYLEKYSDRTDSGWWNADGTYIPRDRSKFYQFGYSWRDHLTNPVIQPVIDAISKIPVHIKQESTDHDYVSQIKTIIDNGMKLDGNIQYTCPYCRKNENNCECKDNMRVFLKSNYACPEYRENENVCDCKKYHIEKYKEEMGDQVVEAMEKDKFIDGKTTYSGTLNKCSTDLAAIKQLAGIDWGKKNSQSIGTVSDYWLNGSVGMLPISHWEHHPVYLQLKENSAINCYIDNKGKIKGAVSAAGKQWYFDFVRSFYENKNIANVINISHSENAYHPNVLHFEIQLIEYTTETKPIPKMIYEVGSDKPFYEQCAVCNQCDELDQYKPKTEHYTCQKCWPR